MNISSQRREEVAILEALDNPAMLVTDENISYANAAATALLGSHISGQNIRLAIRIPAAIETIMSTTGGKVRVNGLGIDSSIFDLACHLLPDGMRLVTLRDMSVQISVARAHADFVANASHELRTPLASIIGYVETLSDPKAGDDAATRQRFLEIIKGEAKRMEALIDDLLSLSRIEAGKHDTPEAEVDLLALLREEAGHAPIDIEFDQDAISVQGDRGQLAQVVRNLIQNAVKYGAPGGTVRASIESTQNGWTCLTVHNDGDPVPPEHLPRLTERFYRVDAGRSRAAGGTGLGLSIVKHIVERHRGRFDITSREGEGTSAFVMLPTART